MFKRLKSTNNKGFTLIELMIVIAIIGILAAIAIPNFIAYRNKSFCSAAESDANAVASAIADYFAIPSHTAINDGDVTVTMSGGNSETVTATAPNTSITITVTDASGRCPADYQAANDSTVNASGEGWDQNNIYTKVLQQ